MLGSAPCSGSVLLLSLQALKLLASASTHVRVVALQQFAQLRASAGHVAFQSHNASGAKTGACQIRTPANRLDELCKSSLGLAFSFEQRPSKRMGLGEIRIRAHSRFGL